PGTLIPRARRSLGVTPVNDRGQLGADWLLDLRRMLAQYPPQSGGIPIAVAAGAEACCRPVIARARTHWVAMLGPRRSRAPTLVRGQAVEAVAADIAHTCPGYGMLEGQFACVAGCYGAPLVTDGGVLPLVGHLEFPCLRGGG